MSLNTITLAQAQEWASNWNENKLTYLAENDLKAFAIPGQVIADVSAPEDVVDVRTYFGLDADNNPHLMVVGVDDKGNDMIDEANGYFIYNFARPCPNWCNGVAPFINDGRDG